MTAKVYLLPSGRNFSMVGRESILEAALRAGINLPYGCANGNCGKCRARLETGAIKKIKHQDFTFSEAEKTQGMFLTCCHAPVCDIEIEVDITTKIGDIPERDIIAKVKKNEPLSDQVRSLHVRLARTDKIQFLAGQSVLLGGNEHVPEATHHIASCPCNAVNMVFHIPLVPDDPFSMAVFNGDLSPSDTLRIRGPYGDFVLFEDLEDVPDAKGRDDEFALPPLTFIGWHTGFAPLRSLIEHAMSFETEDPLHLYRLSPVPDDVYLDNLCRSWDDALDNLTYHQLPDRFTLMSGAREAETLIEKIIAKHDDIAHHEIYVAGPENLVFAARKMLNLANVPTGNIKTHIVSLGL